MRVPVEKQQLFALTVARFILALENLGYRCTLGEAWRNRAVADAYRKSGIKASPNSLHWDRLAIDLQLFKDGVWLTETPQYAEAGKLWESYSTPDNEFVWGGRFGDGNHFSLKHGTRM